MVTVCGNTGACALARLGHGAGCNTRKRARTTCVRRVRRAAPHGDGASTRSSTKELWSSLLSERRNRRRKRAHSAMRARGRGGVAAVFAAPLLRPRASSFYSPYQLRVRAISLESKHISPLHYASTSLSSKIPKTRGDRHTGEADVDMANQAFDKRPPLRLIRSHGLRIRSSGLGDPIGRSGGCDARALTEHRR